MDKVCTIRISKKFEWLRPYLREAAKTHPRIGRVRVLYKMPGSLDKRHQSMGQMQPYTDGRYKIGMYATYQKITFKVDGTFHVRLLPLSKMDIIEVLAHELAHIYHHYHTPKHKKLECRFKTRFATLLERSGYISEEHELA